MCDKVHELPRDDIAENSSNPRDQNAALANTVLGRWKTRKIAAIFRIEWLAEHCPQAPVSLFKTGWRAYFDE